MDQPICVAAHLGRPVSARVVAISAAERSAGAEEPSRRQRFRPWTGGRWQGIPAPLIAHIAVLETDETVSHLVRGVISDSISPLTLGRAIADGIVNPRSLRPPRTGEPRKSQPLFAPHRETEHVGRMGKAR
jgi:hypothetical protein